MSLREFREETRAWLKDNLPDKVIGRGDGFSGGSKGGAQSAEHKQWFDACYERGFTVPTWPTEYGGAGLSAAEDRVLREEMAAARAPGPLGGMGVTMIGPTLLEYGTDDQRHAISARSPAARFDGARVTPNPTPDRIWHRCRPARSTRATPMSSTARRSGPRVRISPTGYSAWCARIPMRRNTKASASSCFRWTTRESR